MKINILKFIGFFVMIVFLASCDKDAFEEYNSVPADGAPTLTVTILSNTDSTLTVSYNMSVAGRVTLAVIPTVIDTPAIADLEARVIDGASFVEYYVHDNGNAYDTITYTGLMPFTSYRVFGIGHNTDGVVSSLVITDAVVTQDFANPTVVGFTPARAELGTSATVLPTIEFNEPVTFVDGKSIIITSFFYGYSETIIADSIVYDGNKVSFKHSDFPFNDYIFINAEEGAFEDASGNISAEIYTVNGVQLDWYFKVGPDPVTVLANIFENFLGDYSVTDYDNADSVSVDWGPYDVTITEDENVEFGVIIQGFWGWSDASAKFQFHADGTISCAEQIIDGIDLGSLYGSYYDGYSIWVKGWSPDQYLPAVGYWNYTDFSFDISISFLCEFGYFYSDIYQVYTKDAKAGGNYKQVTSTKPHFY